MLTDTCRIRETYRAVGAKALAIVAKVVVAVVVGAGAEVAAIVPGADAAVNFASCLDFVWVWHVDRGHCALHDLHGYRAAALSHYL